MDEERGGAATETPDEVGAGSAEQRAAGTGPAGAAPAAPAAAALGATSGAGAAPLPPPAAAPALPATTGYVPPPLLLDPLAPYRRTVRRIFTVWRHVLGLLAGGVVAYVRALPAERRRGLRSPGPRLTALVVGPFVARTLRDQPFPVQLRRRLELLGPTFIKLGQILAIREDLLPSVVTRELQQLFDRLPPIPYPEVRAIIERTLRRPVEQVFAEVAPTPIGSASIAQAHRARLLDGTAVVVKVIKPGIADVIEADLRLLRAVGHLLQAVIPRYQPRQIIEEFGAYTIREVDYNFEADNAEMFAANFADEPAVRFPRIFREASGRDVLTMEFFDGFKPGSARTAELTPGERARVIDLGAGAIVRMLYQDGFFHADLHAGNLMVFPPTASQPVTIGFIDLGMVGRFEERTRRRMLSYFHALVSGDVEGAARLLADMATVGAGGDLMGFRRALADLGRRFVMQSRRGDFSIAQLILASVGLGGQFRVYFPVEMTLMVKALVTFEGVGRTLDPSLDVAAVSREHVTRIFRKTFDPRAVVRELWRSAPEMLDLVVQLPQLASSGFRVARETLETPRKNALAGVKASILAGACVIGGTIALVQGAAWPVWVALYVVAVVVALAGE